MKSTVETTRRVKPLNVLLIGNNPIEMGGVLEKLNRIRSRKIITEIAFDVKSIIQRLMLFKPNYILIDDNIGRNELMQTLNNLSSNRKTRDIPIAVLKNSNYAESLAASSILDYLLKQNLSSESLYHTLTNSLNFKKTQLYLHRAYNKRKDLLKVIQLKQAKT